MCAYCIGRGCIDIDHAPEACSHKPCSRRSEFSWSFDFGQYACCFTCAMPDELCGRKACDAYRFLVKDILMGILDTPLDELEELIDETGPSVALLTRPVDAKMPKDWVAHAKPIPQALQMFGAWPLVETRLLHLSNFVAI